MRSKKPMHLCRKSLFWSKCINKYRIGFCNLRVNITYHYLPKLLAMHMQNYYLNQGIKSS